MTHPLATGEHGVVELFEVECLDVPGHILEPNHGVTRAILKPQHIDFALFLILLQRRRNGFSAVQVPRKGDGVFEAQFCPGANREMRSVGGIAD